MRHPFAAPDDLDRSLLSDQLAPLLRAGTRDLRLLHVFGVLLWGACWLRAQVFGFALTLFLPLLTSLPPAGRLGIAARLRSERVNHLLSAPIVAAAVCRLMRHEIRRRGAS